MQLIINTQNVINNNICNKYAIKNQRYNKYVNNNTRCNKYVIKMQLIRKDSLCN